MTTSAETLREYFHYSPETGEFTRIKRSGRSYIGTAIAPSKTTGYIYIRVRGTRLAAHQWAFLYMTGQLPTQDVDHINRIKTDNRWENLRLATRSENNENRTFSTKNKTGLPGIYRTKTGSFCAEIIVKGHKTYLGTFKDANRAHEAYVEAKKQFHKAYHVG